MKDLPKNGPKSEYLEGFLFPDTYNFKSDDPPEYLIQSMLDNFNEKFTDKMRQQASDQGMSVRDVVTLASIVEREAAISDERPIIASLYLNRMAIDMPLQSDPTVQYVLGKEGDWWPTVGGSDIQSTDSSYNTYNNRLAARTDRQSRSRFNRRRAKSCQAPITSTWWQRATLASMHLPTTTKNISATSLNIRNDRIADVPGRVDIVSQVLRLGIIGDPVAHSISPAMQQPALDAIEGEYRL